MRRDWTKEEMEILKTMYPNNYAQVIADILMRPVSSIYFKANRLGIKKSDQFKKMELQKQGERLKIVGIKYRFMPGNPSHNKGVKMPPKLKEKIKHTFFKKSSQPWNTKYDGHERICSKEGYVLIRVRAGKYVHKHVHLWESVNGKVPKGMCITFKDANRLNISLDNLESITRQENMKRNSIQRFPTEIKSTIKLLHKLNKSIKNAKKQN